MYTCCRNGSDGCGEYCDHGGLCGTIFCRWCKDVFKDGSQYDNKWTCFTHTHSCVKNPANDLLELESGALVPVLFVENVTAGDDGSFVVNINPPDGLFEVFEDAK